LVVGTWELSPLFVHDWSVVSEKRSTSPLPGQTPTTGSSPTPLQLAADNAHAEMVLAKLHASTAAPDYPRAVEVEMRARQLYAQRSFTEAATDFRAATELFSKALTPPVPSNVASLPPAPPTPAPVTPTPGAPSAPIAKPSPSSEADVRAAVVSALESYVRAIETKDIGLLRQVRPGLTDEQISRTRASNEIKRSQKVDLKVDEITIEGDEAQAVGHREDVITLRDGQVLRQALKFTYTLKRGPQGWVIREAREGASSGGPAQQAKPQPE